ncbi:Endoglucanase-5 [Orbilia brochopaga]|nr:Endoglucanase-5 [Drechslerella brochopaga]
MLFDTCHTYTNTNGVLLLVGGTSQTLYGQCGGNGWTGPTACASGGRCWTQNAYYAQCTPA